MNDNLLELLTSCESFELRVSVLEQNCNENFRELFELFEKTQQQQKDDEDNSTTGQLQEGTVRQPWEGSAVPPLAPTVPMFTQPPPTFPYAPEPILDPVQLTKLAASNPARPRPQPQPFMNSAGIMVSGTPPFLPHAPLPHPHGHPPPVVRMVLPSTISTLNSLATNNNNPSTHIGQKTTEPVTVKAIDIITDDKYSLLVGKEGETIDAIREASGATVTIMEKTDKPPSKYYEVSYSGSFSCVSLAREMVDNIVK